MRREKRREETADQGGPGDAADPDREAVTPGAQTVTVCGEHRQCKDADVECGPVKLEEGRLRIRRPGHRSPDEERERAQEGSGNRLRGLSPREAPDFKGHPQCDDRPHRDCQGMASDQAVRSAVQSESQDGGRDQQAAYCPTSTTLTLEPRVDSTKPKSPRPRQALIISLATFATLAPLDPALASNGPPPQPPEISAVDVYRESVPTSGGPNFLGSGVVRSTRLEPAVVLRLRRGART